MIDAHRRTDESVSGNFASAANPNYRAHRPTSSPNWVKRKVAIKNNNRKFNRLGPNLSRTRGSIVAELSITLGLSGNPFLAVQRA